MQVEAYLDKAPLLQMLQGKRVKEILLADDALELGKDETGKEESADEKQLREGLRFSLPSDLHPKPGAQESKLLFG